MTNARKLGYVQDVRYAAGAGMRRSGGVQDVLVENCSSGAGRQIPGTFTMNWPISREAAWQAD